MEIISEDQFKKLIKNWKAYSKLEKINTYGNPIEKGSADNKEKQDNHEA
jgi:hypothetical protein